MEVAEGFVGRLLGSRPTPTHGILVRGWSVHSLWMREPLTVIALDRGGRVLATGRLLPGRVWSHFGAVAILELPGDRVPPRCGDVVEGRPIRWDDARSPRPLRHTHRQPR